MDKDRDKDELIEEMQQKIQTKMASCSKCENNIRWKDGAIANLANELNIAKVELNSTQKSKKRSEKKNTAVTLI